MTNEEIDSAIGRLVTRYQANIKEHAVIRSEIGTIIEGMRKVVDSALAGQFDPYQIDRSDVPNDGWSPLSRLLSDLAACRVELQGIEHDLCATGLGDLIQKLR